MITCISCLRKHLAVCKSFIREVINGHGEGAVPDHRIDIEGELVNAEYHASVIDKEFTQKLRAFRRSLQNRYFNVNANDMKIIDVFYYITDKFQNSQVDQSIIDLYLSFKRMSEPSNVTMPTSKNGCGCKKNKG